MTDGVRRLPVVQTGQLPASTPVFQRVAVVGLGLIGGSLAMAVRQAWPAALVIGIDNNDVVETAIRLHAVDVGADDPIVAAEADLVVLAAPGGENERMLARLPAIIPGEAVVTDVGSAKRTIVAAAAALPGRLAFVGGHPFAGSTRAGIAAARADLFRGRPWFLTPQSAPDTVMERLRGLVRAVGGNPVAMAPAEHDRLLAYLSQMPQVAASAIMQVVGEAVGDEGLGYAGRGPAARRPSESSQDGLLTRHAVSAEAGFPKTPDCTRLLDRTTRLCFLRLAWPTVQPTMFGARWGPF
jgi:prephenate dehydrogenase